MIAEKERIIADKLIVQMREDGLTYGEIINVIRAMQGKFKRLLKVKKPKR